MESDELLKEKRRLAVLESIGVVDPGEALNRFRRYLESSAGSLNEWDERFVTFIREHSGETLLGGTGGDDIHFVFSPEARAGFWVVAGNQLRGKGFFVEADIERLTALAVEKGVLTS